MLSQGQVVRARQSIEKYYKHTCSIVAEVEHENEDFTTSFGPVTLVENQPCRISFTTIDSVSEKDMSYRVIQVVKLFLAPEITVPEGSKITVSHDGRTDVYNSTGKPAVYPTHQEIIMKTDDKYA